MENNFQFAIFLFVFIQIIQAITHGKYGIFIKLQLQANRWRNREHL